MKDRFQKYRYLLALFLLMTVGTLPAQHSSPYHISWERDAYYLGGGLGVTLLGFHLKANTPKLKLSDLDLGKVNSFDRIATTYSSGRADKQRQVQQIKSFIQNTNQTNLNLKQDDRLLGYLFGGVFAGVGIIVLFSPVFTPIRTLFQVST